MSKHVIYQIPVITITEVETQDLSNLCDQLIQIIKDKFSRISNAISPCAISIVDENLFIYDEYGVISDMQEILSAFGLSFESIKLNGVKGRQYQAQDSMFELISLIKAFYRVEVLANQIFKKDDEFLAAIKLAINEGQIVIRKTYAFTELTSNKYVQKVLSASLMGENIQSEKKEIFVEDYDDGKLVSRTKISEFFEEPIYKDAVKTLSETLVKYGNEHRAKMVAGTTATVESRAKKMGYTVQKKKVGQEIEIVLVRTR